MSSVSRLIRNRVFLIGAAAVTAVTGAGLALHPATHADAQSPAAAVAAIPVSVRTIKPESVRIWSEFSGRLHAVDSANIRPEVSGRVVEVRFRDGQTVKAGDILFVIDPRPYEAAEAKAEANLASAFANVGYAKSEFERAGRLVKTQAVAQSLYDQRGNAYRTAHAAVQAAQADLEKAKIDLDHAYVKAPISGRVSRAEVTLGNLVQAGPNAPVLTSIVSDDGIYADFEVDEQTYMNGIHAHAETHAEEQRIPVELRVDGNDRTYEGTISSFDNRIDVASGTIRARARFANEDRSLVPGMFVSVRLASGSETAALLAPLRAIGSNQSKRFVYVADDRNKVAYREVVLGQQVDGQRRIVLSGLKAGDRLIVDGLQHVRPGAAVEVREAGAAGAADGSLASK